MIDINDLDFINITFNSVLVVCSVFNISLNILLVYLIRTRCDLKQTEIILILILCCIEITEGSEILLLSILKFCFGYHFLDRESLQCQIYGFIMQMFLRIEITMVTILSIIRYCMVWYKIEKSLKFWLMCLLLGLCPATSFFLYGAIIEDGRPSPSYIQCHAFFGPEPGSVRIMFMISFCFLIPCWLTTFFYFSIGWKANKQLNVMRVDAVNCNDQASLQMIRNQKLKLMIQLAVVFILYNGSFMFSYITFILKFAIGFKRPPFLDALIFVMVNSSICLNPLITVSFQPEVNNEFVFLLVRYRARCKSIFKGLFRLRR